jgi:hypothetical protein
MRKSMLLSSVLLSMMSFGFSTSVLAAAGDAVADAPKQVMGLEQLGEGGMRQGPPPARNDADGSQGFGRGQGQQGGQGMRQGGRRGG